MKPIRGAQLGAMRVADPKRWRQEVEAVVRTTSSRRKAAAALGVSLATLHRWLAMLPDLRRQTARGGMYA